MRTVIPFPRLHAIDCVSGAHQGHSGPIEFPSTQVSGAEDTVRNLPEGESTSAAIDESAKARALQGEIVELIRAVRSRFG